jgi:hypothetical protein
MNRQTSTDRPEEQIESTADSKRHPITLENSPEETIKRMRSLPERASKLREALRARRETRSR